jgi:hypothetical protein
MSRKGNCWDNACSETPARRRCSETLFGSLKVERLHGQRFEVNPTEAKARIALQEQLLRINGSETYRAHVEPTFGVVIDRFIQEERLVEIMAQPPDEVVINDGLAYSTAAVYTSFLSRHIRPRWGKTCLSQIKPLDVEWLKTLDLAPKSKARLKRMLHLLFERAMLWGLVDVIRNPLELVKVKGSSRREKPPTVLTPEEFRKLAARLQEPYRVMATVAICTGLRISEVLALRWEHIDFTAGTMLVQRGVVNGRIGKNKTEASKAEIPLDGDFAQVLLDWRATKPYANTRVGIPIPRHWGMLPRRNSDEEAHQARWETGWSRCGWLTLVPPFLPRNAG